MNTHVLVAGFCFVITCFADAQALRFAAQDRAGADRWQREARERLYELMMGGGTPERGELDFNVVKEVKLENGCVLQEFSLRSLPDRPVHGWLGLPAGKGKRPAVLALHGHGGSGEQVVRGEGLYWYGKALLEKGFVIISPDIGSHALQHTNWSLMGERVWDAIRCVDYLVTRADVDAERLSVAGLSLGGETTMYVAALDERMKSACSSGWLTTISNMKKGHCPCWNFPGLEEHFEFSDVFACVAPRPLVMEIGRKERAPGGFPVEVAQEAYERILQAYRVFGSESRAVLTVHHAGHVFDGRDYWQVLGEADKVGD